MTDREQKLFNMVSAFSEKENIGHDEFLSKYGFKKSHLEVESHLLIKEIESDSVDIDFSDIEVEIPKGYRTFDEWSNDGYRINKGEKATFFNNKPYFHLKQVQEMQADDYYDFDYGFDDIPF